MSSPLDPGYIDQIKGFEGYSAQPAWDYKQSSSGYGTKAQPGDDAIPPDQLQAVHEQRLNDEIGKASAHVDSVNPNLPPGARAALISLTYNAGPGWANSGLGDLVRNGDLEGAKAKLLEYNKAGGEVNPGLVNRRAQEAAWFDGQPSPQTAPPVAQTAQPVPQQGAPATPASPGMGIPAPQAPIFPQGGGGMGQMPAPQMAQAPPIFTPPRRPIDLSKLQAALRASGNRGPLLSRGS